MSALPSTDEATRSRLAGLNHRMMRGALIEALTHADFLATQADGTWLPRAAFVARARDKVLPADSCCQDVQLRLFGRVALAHGVFAASSPQGVSTRLRYTDVLVENGDAWRLVSSQDTAIGASAVGLPQASAAAHAWWPPQTTAGRDDEDGLLRAINDRYVQAFREADQAWYDANLAPDYLVVQSDGSFHDRASALTRFGLPTFANSMRSFPVGRVKVRRFADIALIHAENAYQLKDGRRGVSRYTDIWQRQGGRWLCVAAHITTHTPAGGH